jgi:hypothetical protein
MSYMLVKESKSYDDLVKSRCEWTEMFDLHCRQENGL